MEPLREEFVSRTARRRNDAASRGVTIEYKNVEFVSLTALIRKDAVMRGVPIKHRREGSVGRTAQMRRCENNAALKDVPI